GLEKGAGFVGFLRDVFGRAGGDEITGVAGEFAVGFDQAGMPADDAGGDVDGLVDGDFAFEADVQFTGETGAAAGPDGGPDHGFVSDGGEDSAVDDALETDVIWAGFEGGLDDTGVGVDEQGEMQAVGITGPAD